MPTTFPELDAIDAKRKKTGFPELDAIDRKRGAFPELDAVDQRRGLRSGQGQGRDVGPTWNDYRLAVARGGINTLATAPGQGLTMLGRATGLRGLQETGERLRAVGERNEAIATEGMTPGGRAPQGLWNRATMSVTESVPGIVAMALPTGVASRGLRALGAGQKIAGKLGMKLATKGAARVANAVDIAIPSGAIEGVFSGEQAAAQTEEEIRNTPVEKLQQQPEWQKAYAATDPALDPGERSRLATEAITAQAGSEVFKRTALSTGTIGALTGGGVLATLVKPTSKGFLKEFGKNLLQEFEQEFLQSGPEQLISNLAKRDYVNKDQDPMEGVLDAAIIGGLAGGLMGGIGGGFHALTTPKEDLNDDQVGQDKTRAAAILSKLRERATTDEERAGIDAMIGEVGKASKEDLPTIVGGIAEALKVPRGTSTTEQPPAGVPEQPEPAPVQPSGVQEAPVVVDQSGQVVDAGAEQLAREESYTGGFEIPTPQEDQALAEQVATEDPQAWATYMQAAQGDPIKAAQMYREDAARPVQEPARPAPPVESIAKEALTDPEAGAAVIAAINERGSAKDVITDLKGKPTASPASVENPLQRLQREHDEGMKEIQDAIDESHPGVTVKPGTPDLGGVVVSRDGTEIHVNPKMLKHLEAKYPGKGREALKLIIDEELIHQRHIKERGGGTAADKSFSDEWQSATPEEQQAVKDVYGDKEYVSMDPLTGKVTRTKMDDVQWGAELARMREQARTTGRITESIDPSRSEAAGRAVEVLNRSTKQETANANAQGNVLPAVEDGPAKAAEVPADQGKVQVGKVTAKGYRARKAADAEGAPGGDVKTWHRGTPPDTVEGRAKASGDTFYSASKGTSEDYAGRGGKITKHGPEVMPSNPLRVESKEALAETMGEADPDNAAFALDFDAKAKAYAQGKGHDGILYENGSQDFNTGERPQELHVFQSLEKTPAPQKTGEKPASAPLTAKPSPTAKKIKAVRAAAKPDASPKVGAPLRIMSVESKLAVVETVGGVRYELFDSVDAKKPGLATIRMTDVDSGKVVTIVQHPTWRSAFDSFTDAVESAKKGETKPAPAASDLATISDEDFNSIMDDASKEAAAAPVSSEKKIKIRKERAKAKVVRKYNTDGSYYSTSTPSEVQSVKRGKKQGFSASQGKPVHTYAVTMKDGAVIPVDAISREEAIEVAIAERAKTATPANEKASVKDLSDILKDASKAGVKGADEAMKGLYKLFGSGKRVSMMLPSFDEETYAEAKPHFQAAYKAFTESGKSLKDFFVAMLKMWGDSVRPYLERFRKDLQSERDSVGSKQDEQRDAISIPGGEGARGDQGATGQPAEVPAVAGESVPEPGRGAGVESGQPAGERGGVGGRQPGGRGIRGVAQVDAGGTAEGPVTGEAGVPAVRPDRDVGNESRGRVGDNLRLDPSQAIEPTGEAEKVRSNIEALALLKTLESEKRKATPAEKLVLAKYVGWGFFKEAFNNIRAKANDASWEKKYGRTYRKLKELLTEEEFEDPADETLMDMAQVVAHLTGDTRAVRMAELTGLVRNLDGERRAFESEMANRESELRSKTRGVESAKSRLPVAQTKAAEAKADIDGKDWTLRSGTKTFTERKDVVAELDAMFAKLDAAAKLQFIKTKGRENEAMHSGMMLNGYPVNLYATTGVEVNRNRKEGEPENQEWRNHYYAIFDKGKDVRALNHYQGEQNADVESGGGVLQSLASFPRKLAHNVEYEQNYIKKTEAEIVELNEGLKDTWPKYDELDKLQKELSQIQSELAGTKKKTGEKPVQVDEAGAVISEKPAVDPRILKAFEKKEGVTYSDMLVPNMPETLEKLGRADLAEDTAREEPQPDGTKKYVQVKKTAAMPKGNPLVDEGFLAEGEHSREDLHDAIIRFYKSRGVAREFGDRVVTMSAGGGGAGKTFILKRLFDLDPDEVGTGRITINADEIKELLPEFSEIIGLGDGRAARITHEESSYLAKKVLNEALTMGSNVIYDATLADYNKTAALVARFRKEGYKVNIIGVTIDPYEALIRAYIRAADKGRYVPNKDLLAAHKNFNANVMRYATLADKFYYIDNTAVGVTPQMLYSTDPDLSLEKGEEIAYGISSERARINENASTPEEISGPGTKPGPESRETTAEVPLDAVQARAGEATPGQEREPSSGRFSSGRRDQRVGLSTDAVTAAIADLSDLAFLPNLQVVQSQSEIPEHLQSQARRSGFATIAGVYDIKSDRIWLVADNIYDEAQARRGLLHEAAAHYGLRKMLGKKYDTLLDDTWESYQGHMEMIDVLRGYRLDKNSTQDKRIAAEEFIARIAEGGIREQTVWNKIVAAIRQILRGLGLVKEVTENDIRAMLSASVRNLRSENGGAFSGYYARFSGKGGVSPEQEAAYLELAKDPEGNKVELQRMVDEAAKKAGYGIGPMYNGMPYDPGNVFKKNLTNTEIRSENADFNGFGFFFTESKSQAKHYAGPSGVVKATALRVNNPLDLTHIGGIGESDDVQGTLDAAGVKFEIQSREETEVWRHFLDGDAALTAAIKDAGYDAVKFMEPYGYSDKESYAVFDSNQIKSAAPITRDDQGNVIPLSQRFNAESPDIRFSATSDPTGPEAELIQQLDRLHGEILDRAAGTGFVFGKAKAQAQAAAKAITTREKFNARLKGVREAAREKTKDARLAGYMAGKRKGRVEGLAEAFREGVKKAAMAVKQARQEVTVELQDIKSQISEAIKEALPVEEQGHLITALTNAKTENDVFKALVRIDEVAEAWQKRTLIRNIRREFQRVLASKAIAIDYVKKIRAVMEPFILRTPRQATLERLQATQDYIDKEAAAGNDIELPHAVLAKLRLLSAKPIAELSSQELADILGQIRTLAGLGKTKLRARRTIDKLNKERDTADILASGTQPMNDRDMLRGPIGEGPGVANRFRNMYRTVADKSAHLWTYLMPMDVVMDMLDGQKGYQGAIHRIFKARSDMGYGVVLAEDSQTGDEYTRMVKRLKIGAREMERIAVAAFNEQPTGREKLVKNNGLTEEAIDAVVLTANEQAMLDYMRTTMDAEFPAVKQVMKNVYNQDVTKVQKYFPMATDWSLTDSEIIDGYMLDEQGKMMKTDEWLKKNPQMGFTIKRTGAGRQALRLNAGDVFLKHMRDVHYMKTMAPITKYMSELARRDEVAGALGDFGQRLVLEYVDTLARKGSMPEGTFMRGLDLLRRNIGAATMGFKATSILIQPTALLNSVGMIGHWAGKGALDMANSREWRAFVKDHMPEVANRIGDDPAYLEFGGGFTMRKIREVGYWPLAKLDMLTAASVGIGAYQKYAHEHGLTIDFNRPDPKAVQYAQLMVRRTQSSPYVKDVPLMVSRGKGFGSRSLAKAFLQFQNFTMNEFSLLAHDGLRDAVKRGKVMQAFNIFLWSILSTTSIIGIRGAIKGLRESISGGGDDDDTEFWMRVLREKLQVIPFMSQFMSVAAYGGEPAPVADAARDAITSVKQLTSDEESSRARGAVGLAAAAGRFAGVPGTVQAEQLVRDQIRAGEGGGTFKPRTNAPVSSSRRAYQQRRKVMLEEQRERRSR